MQIRVSALLPVLLSIAAFILSLLVLISGYTTKFLQDVFVLKIDTSQIAENIDLSTVLADAGISSAAVTSDLNAIDSALGNLTSEALGSLLNTAAHELGLHDFYTAHVITWCEGTLVSSNSSSSSSTNIDKSANTTNSPQKVNACSTPTEPFSFNPVKILESELLHNITLASIGFPTTDVDKVVSALEMAYRAMSVCYLVGVILAGLCILGSIAAFASSRVVELLTSVMAFLGFLVLAAASAIGTVIAVKVREVVNQKAAGINVHAYSSDKFLGMTWAATALMLLVAVGTCAMCCCGGHSRGRFAKGEPYVADRPPRRFRW